MSDTADPTPDPLSDLPPTDDPQRPASIGVATRDADGTLRLQLVTRTAGGMIGEMTLVSPPDDPRHAGYLQHLGGLEPGRSKPIPPFPPPVIDPNSV